ncbi:arylamine N-acetyltransferase [Sphaerisporangium sp. NPDC051011]|uniref:arylamine N-acetyltransferase family protein n=1 Tax=Sphaerisporangium sp. NPDC051011 TaxID=3155792 RepID=UPI003401A2FB
MDESRVDAYLARIGVPRPAAPGVEALREIHRAHLMSVPFENLSIHLGQPIVLEEDLLVAKIVDQRRGGFCYELNGALAALLTALGYHVTRLAARVFGGDRRPGLPFDHMALRVDLDEPWLVDVGFGAFTHYPVRLADREEQHDPGGVFQVTPGGEYGDLDVHHNGSVEYRLDARPYELMDYLPTCWWHQTSPNSHFTRSLTCSRLTETGRVTLSGAKLIHTVGGEREEVTLESDAEILEAYRTHFGIVLDRVPVVANPPVPTG